MLDIVRFELWKTIGGDEISDNQCSPTDSVVGTGRRRGATEQALGFASLYYHRHYCQYFYSRHSCQCFYNRHSCQYCRHQQHHHFLKHGCDDPLKNRAVGALSFVGSMTEPTLHMQMQCIAIIISSWCYVKGHFGGIEFFGSSNTLSMYVYEK